MKGMQTTQVLPGQLVPPLPAASSRRWERGFRGAVIAADLLAACIAAALAFWVALLRYPPELNAYLLEAVCLPPAWFVAIGLAGGYHTRFLGGGPEEFRRVALGAFGLIAVVGFGSWVIDAEVARSFVLVAMPTAAMLTWVGRYTLRKALRRQRRRGKAMHRTLVVGRSLGVDQLARRLNDPRHGYEVLGACVPEESLPEPPLRTPVVGTTDTIVSAVGRLGVDTVAVLSNPSLDSDFLRRLSWDLEPTGATLLVAPTLVEVAGPRLAVRPVDGLPLLHVEHPRFSGTRRLLKSLYDPLVAATALLVLSPALLLIALAVKLDSPGPVFFRQSRVGRLGRPFTIIKFRTMVADAERRKHEVAHLNESDGPLFKVRQDPRVTPLGAFLRRTSLDELPQLVNVLTGSMSLVGPRPHLPAELEVFGADYCRRLFVKPGLTGLWQISGRSDLSFEESVRLDLRYVENWTLTWDILILWRTLAVMLKRTGAY